MGNDDNGDGARETCAACGDPADVVLDYRCIGGTVPLPLCDECATLPEAVLIDVLERAD